MAAPDRQAFVQRLAPLARQWEQRTGIPASIWIAMGASESNWGSTTGLFGIKGSGTAGSQNSKTWESVNGKRVDTNADFAAYNNPNEAFQAFWDLMHTPYYADALAKLPDDPSGFLHAINAKNYATDQTWAGMIERTAKSTIGPMMADQGPTRFSQMQEGTPPASTDPFDAYLAAKLKQMGGGSSGPNTQVVQDGQGNWQLVDKDTGKVTPLNIQGKPQTSDTRNNILSSGASPSDKYIVYFDAAGNLKTEPNPNYSPTAKNTVPGTGLPPQPDYSGASQGGSDPSGPTYSGGTPDMPVDVYNALQDALKSGNADALARAKFEYEQWHDAQTRQDALDKQNAPLDPTEQAYKQAQTAKLQADTLAIQKALRGVAQAAFSDMDATVIAISDQYKAGKITFPEMNALIEQAHQGLTATLAGTTLMEQQKEAHAVQAAKSRDATDLLNQRVQSSASLGASLFQSATGHVLMPKGQTSLGIDPLAIANQEVNTMGGGQATGDAAAAFLKSVFGGGAAGVGGAPGSPGGFPTTREQVLAQYPHLAQPTQAMPPPQMDPALVAPIGQK